MNEKEAGGVGAADQPTRMWYSKAKMKGSRAGGKSAVCVMGEYLSKRDLSCWRASVGMLFRTKKSDREPTRRLRPLEARSPKQELGK